MTPRQGHPDCTCGHPWNAHLPQAGGTASRCTVDCLDGCREYVPAGSDAHLREWGIRHPQGIRLEPSEAAALADLATMSRSNWAGRCHIVTRLVTPWTESS